MRAEMRELAFDTWPLTLTAAMKPVHWQEGMFLRPHHFQAAQRHYADQLHKNVQWDVNYSWGLRSINIDTEALRNYRFVVRRMQARLRDGTLVNLEDDADLAAFDLKPALSNVAAVTMTIAIPKVQLGRANAGQVEEGARYSVINPRDGIPDENSGQNARPVQFRKLNLRLMTEDQDQAGYETLRIARVEKSAQAEAAPQLDPEYIPPLLACDGWRPLIETVLQPIYDRIGKLVKERSEQVRSRGITFDSHSAGDRQLFEGLRVLNEAYSYQHVMSFAQGVHPLPAYIELARLVGRLSIFGADPEPPDLPRYDHDDLGYCFYQAKKYIDELLQRGTFELGYMERPFVGSGLRMQVEIEAKWLAPAWQVFVGVRTPLKAADCINLLTGRLDLKIGSADRVDDIFQAGGRGLVFTHAHQPPRVLPSSSDLTYFQVDRSVQPEEWKHVQNSLQLALRLNEKLIAGNIQGQKVLKIQAEGRQTTMQFTLFIVPPTMK